MPLNPRHTSRFNMPFRVTRAAVASLCAAVLALSGQATSAQVRLPMMGDAAAEELPVGAERRYGEQIMREVWRDPAYLDDAVLQDYLQALWEPLIEAARKRGNIDEDIWTQFAWMPFLVQDRSVNAFALPGGYVGVHLGLVAMTATRAELASVLAHELSHVTQRHIARSLASASRQNMAGMAAMILGILAASRSGNADMAQAAIAGSQAAVIQGQLNFSRDMEREADRIGFGVFSEAGYAVEGMATMFEKLDQAGRLNDSGGFPYLRSHPLTVERMSEARARAALGGPAGTLADPLHAMMQARARVLMDAGEVALRRDLAMVQSDRGSEDPPGTLYSAALAAILLRDFSTFDRLLPRLQEQVATARSLRDKSAQVVTLLQAEALLAQGDALGAIRLLERGELAGSRAALLLHASAAVQGAGRGPEQSAALRTADQSLRTWVADHPEDASAWSLLARCADALGQPLRSLRAQAESRAAHGDLSAAIDRLRAAQRTSRRAEGADFADASVIDARLRDLEERRRWLAKVDGRESARTPR